MYSKRVAPSLFPAIFAAMLSSTFRVSPNCPMESWEVVGGYHV
jgi:hypothetical protein